MQEKLTERERQVLTLMIEGKGNRGIAHILGVSENIVETHLKRIFQKLGVSSRVELARYVVETVEREQTKDLGEA
jgi:two-component system response regulator DctR